MYQIESWIRYSEVNNDCRLSYPALINYLQDAAIAHSDSRGVGTRYLMEAHRGWVVNSWQIELYERPALNTEILVETRPYEIKGFFGQRNFRMLGKDGKEYARVNSLWVYVDLDTGRPTRVPQEVLDAYTIDEKLDMTEYERKMKAPSSYEEKAAIVVPEYFIDTNHHMNNSRYIEVAASFLAEDDAFSGMQVEYKKAAMLGDTMIPRVTREENSVTIVLADQAGKEYCIVSFRR